MHFCVLAFARLFIDHLSELDWNRWNVWRLWTKVIANIWKVCDFQTFIWNGFYTAVIESASTAFNIKFSIPKMPNWNKYINIIKHINLFHNDTQTIRTVPMQPKPFQMLKSKFYRWILTCVDVSWKGPLLQM